MATKAVNYKVASYVETDNLETTLNDLVKNGFHVETVTLDRNGLWTVIAWQ